MKSSESNNEAKPDNNVAAAYGGGLGIRHLQIAVMSAAAFFAYALRVNLSLAIVAMVDKKSNSTAETYDWNGEVQGYVLASFFVGYVFTQIPAGLLSSKYGGHRFLCAGILISSALSLVLPQCAYMGGWILVCVNRAVQGVSQGFVFPSIYSLLGVWAPPAERSRLASVAVSAQLLGTVVSTPVTGLLISAYGWPYVFYVIGAVGAVFGVIMVFLGADSPDSHRMISYTEKTYIQSSLNTAKEKQRVPWSKVLTSVPYLSTMFVMAFHGGVMVTFLTKIPTYLGTVLQFPVEDNGILTALPFLLSWILTFIWSGLCDLFVGRAWLRISSARKLFNSIAQFGGAIFMVLLANANNLPGNNKIMSVVYLTIAVGLQSGVFVGFQSTFVDLAPNFSGAIYSFSNCMSNLIGIAGPLVVGFIVTEPGSIKQWSIVLYLCASLMAASNVVYVIWSSSETQFWNWPDVYKNKHEYEESKKKAALGKEATSPRRYSLHGAELME